MDTVIGTASAICVGQLSLNTDVVSLPDAHDLTPRARVMGFSADQPYHLVLVGEKSSLRPVLNGVADRYRADLYLPTGEISDTQAYIMAQSAARDGRPMVVFYFHDCDPSGWQMPVSLARKLQALKPSSSRSEFRGASGRPDPRPGPASMACHQHR